jgi:hypothetical protein
MQPERLVAALTPSVGSDLARDLVNDFLKIRQDYATQTLERASPGKFVETFVQCAQQMSRGNYDKNPDVDDYLHRRIENETSLGDGVRVCAGRIARSIYTLRNKRNVAHKDEIDPNAIDLGFCHHASAWIMAELLRTATGISMEEAGRLIALVQLPVNALIEEIDGVQLFLPDASTRVELLALFHARYPEPIFIGELLRSMSRRDEKDVRKRLSELNVQKLVQNTAKGSYVLTRRGHAAATEALSKLLLQAA